MASSSEHPQTSTFTDLNFTYPPSLEHFNITAATWLMKNAKSWDGLATSALVFSPSTTCSKILLVQRTAHDSMPLLWETPGGGVDPGDTSLLAACARELWEETGLQAVEFVRVVSEGVNEEPGSVFTNRTGTKVFCRFAFEVKVRGAVEGEDVEGRVRTDLGEHCDYVWASEEEVREGRAGLKELPLANGQMKRLILDGFRRRT